MRLPYFVRSRRWLFLPPVLVGIVIVVGFASSRRELKRVPVDEQARSLRVIPAVPTTMTPRVTGYGTVEPTRTWTAIAEVGGRVVELRDNLESGERVPAGALLLRIDPTDYELAVERAQADLAQSRARLRELQARREADQASLEIELEALQVAQQEVERYQSLRARNAASQAELDAARTALLRQRQTVQQLRNSLSVLPAQIEAAQAAIETAQTRLAEAQRDVE